MLPDSSCAELEYGGEGDPDVLIASDLPMQGDSAERSEQMVEAIRLVLEDAEWKAGDTNVAFQACDDSIASTGEWDEAQCEENARAYAQNPDVIGVVGTYNSGCAAVEIPILNEAPDGGVAMVSPGNTLICLTEDSPELRPGRSRRLLSLGHPQLRPRRPQRRRAGRGAGPVRAGPGRDQPLRAVRRRGPDQQRPGRHLHRRRAGARARRLRARRLGSRRARLRGADGARRRGLARRRGAGGPAGAERREADPGQGRRRSATTRAVRLLAFDGFAQQATIDDAGLRRRGDVRQRPRPHARQPHRPRRGARQRPRAASWAASRSSCSPRTPARRPTCCSTAIEAGAERAAAIEALFETQVIDGIIGSFEITPSGDPSVGAISVLVAEDRFKPVEQLTPERALIAAARGE